MWCHWMCSFLFRSYSFLAVLPRQAAPSPSAARSNQGGRLAVQSQLSCSTGLPGPGFRHHDTQHTQGSIVGGQGEIEDFKTRIEMGRIEYKIEPPPWFATPSWLSLSSRLTVFWAPQVSANRFGLFREPHKSRTGLFWNLLELNMRCVAKLVLRKPPILKMNVDADLSCLVVLLSCPTSK